MTRRLPLLIAAVILAGVVYISWPRDAADNEGPQGETETIVSLAQAGTGSVPFLIKAKVKLIMEQQQRMASARSRGDIEAAEVRIRLAAGDIRERLMSDGVLDEASMQAVVRAAAAEAGLNEQQIVATLRGFSSANATKSGAKGGFLGGVQKAISEINSR